MNRLQHPVFLAFTTTTILLFLSLSVLATPTHVNLYHLNGPVSVLAGPIFLIFAAIWLIMTLVLLWARRNIWVGRVVYPALSISLPWILLKDCFVLIGDSRPVPTSVRLVFLALVLAVGIYLAVAAKRAPNVLKEARTIGMSIFAFLIFGSVLQVGQALVFCWQARNENGPPLLHHAAAFPAQHHRIVWVVLDELSYQQVYEKRYPGLQLPAFDRLASNATIFSHVVPAGRFTEMVLPSLLTGVLVEKFTSPASGATLHLKDASTGSWQTLDPHRTVFQDALNAGYSTGVAGWFNPYCRILPEVLDHCFWTNQWVLPGGLDTSASIWRNTRATLRFHVGGLLREMHVHDDEPRPVGDLLDHQSDYRTMVDTGDRLLRDPSANFILLHMPIPHPGGIYRRETASFATYPTSYVDNLALCDVYLAHLRQVLEDMGSWDDTTLVVMGDHSWRTWLWTTHEGWTPEDQAASQGRTFDERPAYIVKLARQTTPLHIDAPFAAVRTRSLFDALFAGQITTPQQLSDWAARSSTADKH